MKRFKNLKDSRRPTIIAQRIIELEKAGISVVRRANGFVEGSLHRWKFERNDSVWQAITSPGDDQGVPNEVAIWLDEQWEEELCFGNAGAGSMHLPDTVNLCIIHTQRALNTLAALISRLEDNKGGGSNEKASEVSPQHRAGSSCGSR